MQHVTHLSVIFFKGILANKKNDRSSQGESLMIMTTLRSKKERTRLYPQSQMKMIEVRRNMK